MPVITSQAILDATEDIEYSYQVEVEDPDNDLFTYLLSEAPEGMTITPSGLITWTALEGVLTSGLFTVTVSDGDLTAEQSFEITVAAVNDVPVIVSQASLEKGS